MTDETTRNDSTEGSEVELEVEGEEMEFEIDADAIEEDAGSQSIDEAMREALDAVEQIQNREPTAEIELDASAGDEPGDVAALRAEIADLRERSVRTLADFDNYRKRVERERRDERRYASADLLREFLGVVDNMERALGAGGSVEDLKMGVEMTLKQVQEMLRTHGVVGVEADGARFDPAVHDAVSQVESDAVDAPTVDSVLQRGYILHERLLRPAMVVVAMPSDESSAGSGGATDPEPTEEQG